MPELTGFLTDFVLGRLLEWALDRVQESWELPIWGALGVSARCAKAVQRRAAAIRQSRAERLPPRHE